MIALNIDPYGIITQERLFRLTEKVLQVKHFDGLRLSGLNEDRADVLPG